MTQPSDCRFCHLGTQVLRQNEHAVLALSNPRKVPGHIIVLPKRHLTEPWQLTGEELKDIFRLIFLAEQRLLGKLGDGVDIRQNYRPYMAENDIKVDHVLFHVIPRAKDDYIHTVSEQFEKDLFAKLDDLEAEEVAKLLADK